MALANFTITILLAPYAALPYLLVSLSQLIGGFGLVFVCGFLPSKEKKGGKKKYAIYINKSSREEDQLTGPYGLSIKEIRGGIDLFAQQPHPFCKHATVGSGKKCSFECFCYLLSCKKL